jgi:hypothetical protein
VLTFKKLIKRGLPVVETTLVSGLSTFVATLRATSGRVTKEDLITAGSAALIGMVYELNKLVGAVQNARAKA